MVNTDNENVMSARDRLMSRAQQRFPDRRYTPIDGENGENGPQSIDDLDESINEMMDEMGLQIEENNTKNKQLLDMLYRDPKIADFIDAWMEYGSPEPALVEVFGDELEMLSTPEGREQFRGNWDSWRGRRDESERLQQEADANWDRFLERLDAWGDSKSLDNDTKAKVAIRLIDVKQKGETNSYDEEDFDMALKALRYDDAINNARQEGIINGRNQRIEANRRERGTTAGMPPSISGGRGMSIPAPQPKKERNVWDEVE